MDSIGTWWMWSGFFALVLGMLWVDLRASGGRAQAVSFKQAAAWSGVWVGTALLFAGLLWGYLDHVAGRAIANGKTLEFVTGYLIEKALAVDNVFVWLLLFGYFSIPANLQKRVLSLGIFGALLMRTGMIFGGIWLINQFHWLLYLFGAFLLFTGVQMWRAGDASPDLADNRLLRAMRRYLPLSDTLHGERFVVQQATPHGGMQRLVTPLFLALVLVEVSDLVFALDSIPAIFAVSRDPFIVLTSNVFAILGLRAMYFLLAGLAHRFTLLKPGLALVLVFIGGKMLLMDWVHIPVGISLGVVALIIGTAVVLSLRRPANPSAAPGWQDEC